MGICGVLVIVQSFIFHLLVSLACLASIDIPISDNRYKHYPSCLGKWDEVESAYTRSPVRIREEDWREDSNAMREQAEGFRDGERIAGVSVWTLLAVGIAELAFSSVTGSIALFADGVD